MLLLRIGLLGLLSALLACSAQPTQVETINTETPANTRQATLDAQREAWLQSDEYKQ